MNPSLLTPLEAKARLVSAPADFVLVDCRDARELAIASVAGATHLPMMEIPGGQMGMLNLGDMLGKAFGQRTKPRRMQTPPLHTS